MSDRLLFISMLGDPDCYDPAAFTTLCPSGLERDWIADWHGAVADQFGFRLDAVDICRGEPLPNPRDVGAVVLGGTLHSIAEPRPWLSMVSAWLMEYRHTGRFFLGICGGHQLVGTRIEDGALVDREGGTLMGTVAVDLTPAGRAHPLFRGLPDRPSFHFGNTQRVDPVHRHSDGVLATEASLPMAAMDHGGNWFSCQFHPEARKPEFDCYFTSRNAGYESPYADVHDGPAFLANFLALASGRYERHAPGRYERHAPGRYERHAPKNQPGNHL